MGDPFHNTYEDEQRAASYAGLEYPGTYYLAFRDLPRIFEDHVRGRRALDFGCGAGRSTRFLKQLGYSVTGVDISPEMLRLARQRDPSGDYRLVRPGQPMGFAPGSLDLVLAAFPFDNIPGEAKGPIFTDLSQYLAAGGCIVNLVSSPEIYLHEWVSFSTRSFPENRHAASGDVVRIIMLDVPDARPVEDIYWPHDSHLKVYGKAGLEVEALYHPLGREGEAYPWLTELTISPWSIYVLRRVGVDSTWRDP